MSSVTDLPTDTATLQALLIASEERNARKEDRIIRLEKLLSDFKRALYGAKSEKGHPDQYLLALEDIETAMAAVHAAPQQDSTLRALAAKFDTSAVGSELDFAAHCMRVCFAKIESQFQKDLALQVPTLFSAYNQCYVNNNKKLHCFLNVYALQCSRATCVTVQRIVSSVKLAKLGIDRAAHVARLRNRLSRCSKQQLLHIDQLRSLSDTLYIVVGRVGGHTC